MELIECQNKFKARPAPPETVYPLYHDLVEQSENRRRIVKDIRKGNRYKIDDPPKGRCGSSIINIITTNLYALKGIVRPIVKRSYKKS